MKIRVNGGAPPVKQNGRPLNLLSGATLRRMLHGRAPHERAQLVAQLVGRDVAFVELSAAQIARLVEANPSAVSVAHGHRGTRGPRQRTVDRIVKRYGAEALMKVLDRATAPHPIAAV